MHIISSSHQVEAISFSSPKVYAQPEFLTIVPTYTNALNNRIQVGRHEISIRIIRIIAIINSRTIKGTCRFFERVQHFLYSRFRLEVIIQFGNDHKHIIFTSRAVAKCKRGGIGHEPIRPERGTALPGRAGCFFRQGSSIALRRMRCRP